MSIQHSAQPSHQERGFALEAQAKRIARSAYVLAGVILAITLVYPPGILLLFPCGAIMGCIIHEQLKEEEQHRNENT
jgi:hypothetical protein